ANLAVLQLVADNPGAARDTRRLLKERREAAGGPGFHAWVAFHDIVVDARAAEREEAVEFAQALARAYQARVAALDDRQAHALTRMMTASPQATREALQAALEK